MLHSPLKKRIYYYSIVISLLKIFSSCCLSNLVSWKFICTFKPACLHSTICWYFMSPTACYSPFVLIMQNLYSLQKCRDLLVFIAPWLYYGAVIASRYLNFHLASIHPDRVYFLKVILIHTVKAITRNRNICIMGGDARVIIYSFGPFISLKVHPCLWGWDCFCALQWKRLFSTKSEQNLSSRFCVEFARFAVTACV